MSNIDPKITYNSTKVNKPECEPRFTCAACSKQFPARYAHSKEGASFWFGCNKCATTLHVPFDQGGMIDIDESEGSISEKREKVAERLKPCPCGGKFKPSDHSKCPFCFKSLSPEIWAYPFVGQFQKKAFKSEKSWNQFKEFVQTHVLKRGEGYKRMVEYALQAYRDQKLSEMSDEQMKTLIRHYHLLTADYIHDKNWLS